MDIVIKKMYNNKIQWMELKTLKVDKLKLQIILKMLLILVILSKVIHLILSNNKYSLVQVINKINQNQVYPRKVNQNQK